MRGIVVPEYGDSEVLTEQPIEAQPLAADEVRVEIRAAGVNFADIDQRRGQYRDGPAPPFVPGLEGAGIISERGADVDAWDVGDEVCCFFPHGGAYSESAVTKAAYVFEKPDSLSFGDAGGFLVRTFTAHNVVHEWGGLDSSETVLITAAAGGVGSIATQFAAQTGATVIGAASTESKRTFAEQCGADVTVDPTDSAFVANVTEAVGDGSVDLLLDAVGGQLFKNGLDIVRPGGRIVTYGVASGDPTAMLASQLFYQNKSVSGYHLLNGMKTVPERVLQAEDAIFESIEDGTLSVAVEETRPLSEAATVHSRIENRQTKGRVVLVP